jgi:hypothetical protein
LHSGALVEVSLCVRSAGLLVPGGTVLPVSQGCQVLVTRGEKIITKSQTSPQKCLMKYHKVELPPSKGSLFSLHRSQYYGTESLQKQ